MKTKQKPARSTPISTPTAPAISETPGASVTPALSLFTEAAIVIASFTIVGYLWALSYEVAFFRYFSIPFYFITLNPTAVLSKSASWLWMISIPLIFSLAFYLLFTRIDKFVYKNPKRKFYVGLSLVCCGMLYLNMYYIYIYQINMWILLSLDVLFVIILISLIVYRNKLIDKIKLQEEKRLSDNLPAPYIRAHRVFIGIFLIAVGGGMPFFQYLGNYEAKATTVFPILAQSPEVAVLRIYGEYLLTVPFNRDPNGAVFEN